MLARALALISLLGFADAAWLSLNHFLGRVPPCSIVGGCEVVTTSTYATVGPVPLALIGAIYYLVLVALSVQLMINFNRQVLLLLRLVSGLGVLVSIYLVYLQAFVLNAFCLYCLISAASTTVVFVLTFFGRPVIINPNA